jgi:hypothetical protein
MDSMKTDLKELWSDRLLAHLIANPSKLKYGQEMLHGNLQRLDYDLGDIYTLTPKIKEDIKFQRGINVKLNSGKLPKSGTESITSI